MVVVTINTRRPSFNIKREIDHPTVKIIISFNINKFTRYFFYLKIYSIYQFVVFSTKLSVSFKI